MDEDSGRQKGWRRLRGLKLQKGAFRRRARKIENATIKHAHRFLVRRWINVRDVGRNTVAWLVLVGLLIGLASAQLLWFSSAFTMMAPADGGTYAEGIVGRLETLNPLFASTVAEVSASKLIFSSLLSYDRDNALRPDVADSWNISADSKVYDVTLRNDVLWHDGKRLTADDVVFTVRLMQNESVKALQSGNWVGVRVEKVSDTEVKFILPAPYAPFAQALTFGILPKHILENIEPADIRENGFGRAPVGSGPFSFRQIQLIDPDADRLVVHLEANAKYYRGKPQLNRFQIHTYETRDALKRALMTSEVNAALGLDSSQIHDIARQDTFVASPNEISDGMFAIFNNDSVLLSDIQVRSALLLATDRPAIIEKMYGRGVLLNGPLPDTLVSGVKAKQAALDVKTAAVKLDAAGWKLVGSEREKNGAKLELSVVAPDTGDYKTIIGALTQQWALLGITLKSQLVDTDTIVSDYLQPRNYDILLYELAIGADPDVYPYWHSSQAQAKGLNFANYRSGLADDALSSARARLDPALRAAKYRTFYAQWVRDVPAIALYQPLFNYVSTANSTSLDDDEWLADPPARYRDVDRWSVSQTQVMTTQ